MKRILSVLLVLVLLIGCLAACTGNSSKQEAGSEQIYGDSINLNDAKNVAPAKEETSLTVGRKIIRDAELTVETKTFSDALSSLNKQIEAVGGYVESSETNGDKNSYREAKWVIRVPADKLNTFLDAADGLGNVTYKTTSARDVTSTYVDTKSRIATLTAEQEALTELLKKAGSTSEILDIRDRLTQVTASLESYQAQLNAMDSQVAYSTVTITLCEVELITDTESGFWQEAGTRFLNNLARLGKVLRGFAVWLLGAIPWLVFFGVIALVVVLIIRGSIRRKRRRRAKQQQQLQQEQSN